MNAEQEILWQAGEADIQSSRLTHYREWLTQTHGLWFSDYESLWQWTVDHPELFWLSITTYFKVRFHTPFTSVMQGEMPDTLWFEGSTINYAEHIYAGMERQKTAILFATESGMQREVTVDEMWTEVARLQHYYLQHGVKPGDRIVGYLPNIPEATFAFLAAVSLGAVWSCCSQDFGVSSVVDRFAQVHPTILVLADGYYYNGKTHSRQAEIQAIRDALPDLKDALYISYTQAAEVSPPGMSLYSTLQVHPTGVPAFEPVPFNHPLWILYSSGTTGAPKAITHSHGGCLLEHLKYLAFHNEVHVGEKFFWYTTTGWMMWNFLQASMLHGATIVLYDGSPGYPGLDHLWKLSEQLGIQHFGTSAPFLVACMKEGLQPGKAYDLSGLRSIGSTGSPLPPEAFQWVYAAIHDKVWLCSMSGGTDVCTAFVGGVLGKPVRKGEIQARGLGCSLYAWNDDRMPVTDQLGEMVITKPMPSMPVFFWNDPDKKKYKASYFEDIPGVWRHGDWVRITTSGGVVIYGRSDATLNRQGVRIGTAEIYGVLNDIPEVEDGLIVNLELEGGRHFMPLFIKLKGAAILDEALIKRIAGALKTKCSPRHVPDAIYQVSDIPYTISGKKMEAPVKKILLGMKADASLNRDAMRNPESLIYFQHFKIPPVS